MCKNKSSNKIIEAQKNPDLKRDRDFEKSVKLTLRVCLKINSV